MQRALVYVAVVAVVNCCVAIVVAVVGTTQNV